MHFFRNSFYCSRLFFNSHGHVPLHWYTLNIFYRSLLFPFSSPDALEFLHFSVCFLRYNNFQKSSKKMLVPITKARVASVLRYIAVSMCLEMTRDLSSHVPLTRVPVLCTVCTSFDPLNASLWRFIFRTELECNYTVFNDDRTIEIRVIQMQFTSLFVVL